MYEPYRNSSGHREHRSQSPPTTTTPHPREQQHYRGPEPYRQQSMRYEHTPHDITPRSLETSPEITRHHGYRGAQPSSASGAYATTVWAHSPRHQPPQEHTNYRRQEPASYPSYHPTTNSLQPRTGSPHYAYTSDDSSAYNSPQSYSPYPSQQQEPLPQLNIETVTERHPPLPPLDIPSQLYPGSTDLTPATTSPTLTAETCRSSVGPSRALAPLTALARPHPYRRDALDDRALRLLAPRSP